MKKIHWPALALMILLPPAIPRIFAQQNPPQSQPAEKPQSMPGMDMGEMQHDATASPQTAVAANEDMSEMHMGMGPHMKMTDLQPANAADEKRAEDVLATLGPAIAKYKDYQVALNDGFKIFHPALPQEHYHFTNYSYAFEAQFSFNPSHPTSLLYKKVGSGYELEGAMYTAPRRYTDEQLNERIPLSVARWHEHVNLCLPPKGAAITRANWQEFGLRGSIATEDACNAASGRWLPVVFGWMVHVYPYEADPAKTWAH